MDRYRHCRSVGFDCIPSDLTSYLAASTAAQETGSPCTDVEVVIGESFGGGASGGTIESLARQLPKLKSEQLSGLNCLAPGAPERGSLQKGVRFSKNTGAHWCWQKDFSFVLPGCH